MEFIQNADAVARKAISEIAPSLESPFANVIKFLTVYPDTASRLRGSHSPIGSEEYIVSAAVHYANGRKPKRPKPPATIPDEMVGFILEHYFDVEHQSLERVKKEHALSMAAENIVGNVLEHYLASILEPCGWVWCAGSLVRAVDFIKPTEKGQWVLLQVKNRDNSENSSSSVIRVGTNIKKWHRTFSKKTGSNWEEFPDSTAKAFLSEEGFMAFAKVYLGKIKGQAPSN
jgi:hypothetical protein